MPSLKDLKIPNSSITNAKIAGASNFTAAKIANGAVTGAKISSIPINNDTRMPAGNVINMEMIGNSSSNWNYSWGDLSYTYTKVWTHGYTPKRSDTTIYFEHYYTYHHTRSNNEWSIHLGKIYDETTAAYIAGHCWHGGGYPSQYAHSNSQHFWNVASWGAGVARNFSYWWAPHPGITGNYYGQYSVLAYEVMN